MKVSSSVSGAEEPFSYWLANGRLGHPLLKNINWVEHIDKKHVLVR